MEIVDGELIVTYTDGTTQNLGSIGSGDSGGTSDDSNSYPMLIFTLKDDNTYSVKINPDYKSSTEEIIIPSSYESTDVTEIDEKGFENCIYLKRVSIPETVTTIGANAFYNCIELAVINIPENVTIIPQYAFWGCEKLTTVEIPAKVTQISKYAFFGSGLTSITIPSNVKLIEALAFKTASLKMAYFSVTTGWKAGISSIDSSDLTMPTVAANLLQRNDNGSGYTWTRN